ncbi:MAG TPA: hypothetical protein VHL30_03560, partial [Chlamydiales bacterium]|nr:hypothetical protein [Chlamydiales bacterium]
TAIAYLETALKANKIVLAGYSLGGGSIGEAILQHDFDKSKADFLVVRQVTFGKVSEVAGLYGSRYYIPACLAKHIVRWTGCEMDNVESSRKLARYNIREVIIQGRLDQIIPVPVSLAQSLVHEPLENKKFGLLHWANHFSSDAILAETIHQIRDWEATLQPVEIAE